MHGSLPLGYGFWLVPIIVLAVGTTVIVGLAAIAVRWVRSAAWQRTIWQATTVGLLALLVVELTGSGSAFVQLVHARAKPIDAQTRPAPVTFPAPRSQISGQEASAAAPEPSLGDGVAKGTSGQAANSPLKKGATPGLPGSAVPIRTKITAGQASSGTQLAEGLLSQRAAGIPPLAPPRFPDERQPPIAVAGWLVADRPAMVGIDVAESAAPVETGVDPPPLERTNRVTTSHAAGRGEFNEAPGWWLAVIWALGAATIAGRCVWARLLLVAFRRRHAVVRDEALCRRIAALARRQGIRGPVTVMEAAGLTAPVAFGTFRPTLALPTTFCGEFDPPQQEAMIVHELAHLAGRDPGWQFVADLVCAALWWHPLCWWSRRRLREAGETAADEASLLVPDGPDLLASSLLVLGQRLAGVRPRLGWLSAGGPDFRSGLGRRVERLLSLSDRSWQAPGRAPLALAKTALPVALVIVAILCTAWAHPQVALREGGTTMSVLKTSWRRSLAAAAVAAVLLPISGDAMSQEEREEAAVRRDRDPPERGERPGGEREFLMHQVETLRLALHALREAERGDAIELVERAIRAREVILEGRRDDEAHMIRERAPAPGQLAEIVQMAAGLWREFDNADKAEAVAELAEQLRAPRDREPDRPAKDRERAEREARRRQVGEITGALKREQEELARKALRIERELGELSGGQDEKARELQGALRKTREQMERVERELAEVVRDRPEREREVAARHRESAELQREMAERERAQVAHRLEELKEAHERVRQAGRHEEAERLAREAEEIERELVRRAEGPRRDAPPPEEREEMERRMDHVRVAVENLRAAGLHEQAERLAGEMEHLLRGRPEHPRPHPRDLAAASRGEAPPHPEQFEGVLRELHGAIGQLNERMEGLAQKVENEIQEVRHGVEVVGREIEERTNHFNRRSEDLEREIRELDARLGKLKDLDDDDDDDDDDDEEEEDDDG